MRRRGLQRRLTFANVRAAWDTTRAFVRARRIIRQTQPSVVVGVGGYASLPCLLAARLARAPVVVHEQNAAPGLANRVAVRMGAKPAVSLPGTPLRGAIVTGNPIRGEIATTRRTPDPARPLVAVFGGSLGSGRINEAALDLYDRCRDRGRLPRPHPTGPPNHH